MTIPIGFLGGGGGAAELFVVHGLVAYSGFTPHDPIVAVPSAQVLTLGLTAYSGFTPHTPIVGNAIPHGLVTYSGATMLSPIVDGHVDIAMGNISYSGATTFAPSLVLGQDVSFGLTTYSGATMHSPTVGGQDGLNFGLTTYSGATMLSPTLTGDRVRLVNAWEVTLDATGSFTPSVGTNRVILFHIAYENGTNIGTPTYGGQNLTEIYKFDDNPTTGMFYLDEAGIQAAVGTTFDFDAGPVSAAVSAVATYENVNQASPVFDSIANFNLAGNTPAADIDTFLNGVVVAGAHSGASSEFAWTAPLVEKTDAESGTVTGSVAALLNPAQTTISVEAVGSNLTPNRSGVGAVSLRPTAVDTNITMGVTTYSGATLHNPTVEAAAQTLNMGLTAYSGATLHNPTVEAAAQTLNMGLTSYFGVTTHSPTVASAVTAVTALDSWSEFGGTDTGTYTVSSGSNRILIMCFTFESTGDTVTAPTYGGQTLTEIHNQDVNGGQNGMFYLDEAGIAAASGTTWDATFSVSSGSEIVSIGTYENVAQSSTVFSTASGINLSGETANFDLTTIDKGLAVAHAYCGAALNFTWDAPMTEQTDLTNGSAGGSAAHELNQDGSNVSIGADADGNPNRTGVIAACFRPLGG